MERLIPAGSLSLWSESFGRSSDPAALLIMGAGTQGIAWPEAFCEGLAAAGFFVLRYDHRDVGLSSAVDFAAAPYTLDDLARDALAVLDGWGVERAHVLGLSMGGYVAQLLALDHLGRVRSLTSIASTPEHHAFTDAIFAPGGTPHPSGLPPPSPEAVAQMRRAARLPARTREERVAQQVATWSFAHGDGLPVPEDELRLFAERVVERTRDPRTATHHAMAIVASPGRTARLRTLEAPALVVHGGRDPYLAPAHGEATARAIPGARLELVPEMGHLFFSPLAPRLLAPIVAHLRAAARS